MKKICEVESYNGNVVAVRGLARCSLEEENLDLAKDYYSKALLLNPNLVLFEYTNLLYHSDSKEDHIKCLEVCEEYAKLNNKDALYRIGMMYYSGIAVEINRQKSKEYLQRAADAGSTLAVKDLSILVFNNEKKGLLGKLFSKKK